MVGRNTTQIFVRTLLPLSLVGDLQFDPLRPAHRQDSQVCHYYLRRTVDSVSTKNSNPKFVISVIFCSGVPYVIREESADSFCRWVLLGETVAPFVPRVARIAALRPGPPRFLQIEGFFQGR